MGFPPHPHGTSRADHVKLGDEASMYGDALILLVDDNPMVLGSTKAILEAYGYTVLHAQSPKEAMRVADQHADAIQMLITDIVMPGINGLDLADHLLAGHPGLKCLYMSGSSSAIINDQRELGADAHFIQKPFSMDGLAARVREVLNLS